MSTTNWKVYRKISFTIEACQKEKEFFVFTQEGKMKGKAGDYLIKGIHGEFYPCDKEIFEKSYTRVN